MKLFFTQHSEERMKKRNILREEVVAAIHHPEKTLKKYGIYYFQKTLERGVIEVVVEKTKKNLNVVTVYWV